ncbi:MAG: CDP-alcohol phosphatidyltransferase family protein [Pseudomonadota bacterium]|nr:CDP-alcohol phosphatidyltransferase family protein [Pseudomonadota bacterium]
MNRKPWDARIASFIVTPFVDSRFVHPNHLTSLRLIVGFTGAVCFARGESPNLAALLIVVSNFLDHTDGELARLSGKTSRFGHYFDLASDALVTIGMFAGIGIGLAQSTLGTKAIVMGAIAGVAVAVIFHLRNDMENHLGKIATRQPQWAGFEAEDVLYLMPAVTFSGSLEWFLYAAAVGAPVACVFVAAQYIRAMRSRSRQSR